MDIATLSSKLGVHDSKVIAKAEEYYLKAIAIFEKQSSKSLSLATILANLGAVYLQRGELDAGLPDLLADSRDLRRELSAPAGELGHALLELRARDDSPLPLHQREQRPVFVDAQRDRFAGARDFPARRIDVSVSSTARSRSIQPRAAAASTIAYSPETW